MNSQDFFVFVINYSLQLNHQLYPQQATTLTRAFLPQFEVSNHRLATIKSFQSLPNKQNDWLTEIGTQSMTNDNHY